MKFKCQWNDNDGNVSVVVKSCLLLLHHFCASVEKPNTQKLNWHCSWHVALEMLANVWRWELSGCFEYVQLYIHRENKSQTIFDNTFLWIYDSVVRKFIINCDDAAIYLQQQALQCFRRAGKQFHINFASLLSFLSHFHYYLTKRFLNDCYFKWQCRCLWLALYLECPFLSIFVSLALNNNYLLYTCWPYRKWTLCGISQKNA